MKEYLKLIRVHHYIKNFLVFMPLFFSKQFFVKEKFWATTMGFCAFSILCSCIYIFNDWKDMEQDKGHPKKRLRPLARGTVRPQRAMALFGILLMLTGIIHFLLENKAVVLLAFVFLSINLAYSIRFKTVPILDIVIIAFGYILRVYYGALLIDTEVSAWLYLSVLAFSFFMGFSKRRNEIIKTGTENRLVLKYYSEEFLDKIIYMFLGNMIVFYSLWCESMIATYGEGILFTVPLIISIVLKYALAIESGSDGDPVDTVLEDKILICLISGYIIIMFWIVYKNQTGISW